jgi:hypothetical protein
MHPKAKRAQGAEIPRTSLLLAAQPFSLKTGQGVSLRHPFQNLWWRTSLTQAGQMVGGDGRAS